MQNKNFMIGRLTRDPESRPIGGEAGMVTTLKLAVNRDAKKNEDGTSPADFFMWTSFSKTADYIASFIKKGDLVSIEGHTRSKRWECQTTKVTKYGNDFVINKIKKLASPQNNKTVNELTASEVF